MTTTEQAKKVAKQLRQFVLPNTSVIEDSADTINALVAENERNTSALAERDAEIERVTKSYVVELDALSNRNYTLRMENAAQRKVLEQALGALADQDTDSQTRRHRRTEAITAIQEQLNDT